MPDGGGNACMCDAEAAVPRMQIWHVRARGISRVRAILRAVAGRAHACSTGPVGGWGGWQLQRLLTSARSQIDLRGGGPFVSSTPDQGPRVSCRSDIRFTSCSSSREQATWRERGIWNTLCFLHVAACTQLEGPN